MYLQWRPTIKLEKIYNNFLPFHKNKKSQPLRNNIYVIQGIFYIVWKMGLFVKYSTDQDFTIIIGKIIFRSFIIDMKLWLGGLVLGLGIFW